MAPTNQKEQREPRRSIAVTQGKYICSAVRREQYPEKKLPEIAFIGRSNVGKSSLLNSLARIKSLAKVSSNPGKTQTINFFEMGLRSGEESPVPFYLVDLPGYGYAKASKESRRRWAKFIEEYLLSSEQLRFVCLLIDIRHPPMASDREMLQWLASHDIPTLIIATKSDKLGKSACQKQLSAIRKALELPSSSLLPYSSKKNEGRSDLLDVIRDSLVQ